MNRSNKQLSIKKWKNLEKKWLASNQSQPYFCRKHGVKYTQFAYWRGKFISESKNQAKSSSFAEVVINNDKKMPPSSQSTSSLAEHAIKSSLHHGDNNHLQIQLPTGVRLIVSDGFNLPVLKEVLYLLGVKP